MVIFNGHLQCFILSQWPKISKIVPGSGCSIYEEGLKNRVQNVPCNSLCAYHDKKNNPGQGMVFGLI